MTGNVFYTEEIRLVIEDFVEEKGAFGGHRLSSCGVIVTTFTHSLLVLLVKPTLEIKGIVFALQFFCGSCRPGKRLLLQLNQQLILSTG